MASNTDDTTIHTQHTCKPLLVSTVILWTIIMFTCFIFNVMLHSYSNGR